ncbi:MAG TPA: hypothetical protein VGG39_24660 [Polyangiaceae bacterium]|jgi:hypothetical protein
MRTPIAVAAALAVVCRVAPARACAVCATADTTLTPASQEQSFAGRVQATVDYRQGWVEAGGVTVDDHRLEAAMHVAASREVLLTLAAPLLLRDVSAPGAPAATALVPGDLELRMNRVETTFGAGGTRHRLGVLVALDLPSAPLARGPEGTPLPAVLQPGSGSVVPAGGLDYAIGRGAWTAYAGLSVWLPFAVRAGPHAGESIRTSLRAQWQPSHVLAFRAGGNVNAETACELSAGTIDPDSGGVVVYAAGAIAVTPLPDLVLDVGLLVPAVQALRGDHREGPVATATLAYDF